MRSLFACYTLLLLAACHRSRPAITADCSRARVGEFEAVSDKGIRMHISRTEVEQREVVSDSSLSMIGRIRWTGPCTYILYDQHVLKAPASMVMPTAQDTVQVTIVAIDAEGYDYEATLNHSSLLRSEGRVLFR